MYYGVWTIDLWAIAINLTAIFIAIFVFIIALIQKFRKQSTKLFEISFLIFIAGVLYHTLHAKLLQYPFPVTLPEIPLVDNNLTFNYSLTSLLTFIVIPVLILFFLKRDYSLKSFGLKISNKRYFLVYTVFGVILSSAIFLITYYFFGFKWISSYTPDGLVLWILLVSILSIFCQTFFFFGILFHYYSAHENLILLSFISIITFQSFILASIPWIIATVATSIIKIVCIYKTKNIYCAAFIGISANLIDIFIQIL